MNEDESVISMLEAKGYTVLYPISKEASRIFMEKSMVRVLEHSGYTVTKTGVPKR
jgi:hypothetical protein